jgi:hypothetical protein
VNERQARELQCVLAECVPGGEVTVTAQENGATIVIDSQAGTGTFDIGDGPSRLVAYLLSGRDA